LDPHAFKIQGTGLKRGRDYDAEFEVRVRHPKSAPQWAFKEQRTPVDTEFSEHDQDTPVPIEVDDSPVPEGSSSASKQDKGKQKET